MLSDQDYILNETLRAVVADVASMPPLNEVQANVDPEHAPGHPQDRGVRVVMVMDPHKQEAIGIALFAFDLDAIRLANARRPPLG